MNALLKSILTHVNALYYRFLHVKSARRRFFTYLVFSATLFGSWLCGYKWRDGRIMFQKFQISHLTEKRDELHTEIDTLELQLQEYNFIINDKDYYRYLAFKYGGVIVPPSVPKEDLLLMVEQAKKYKIPLRYFFRLIYRESRFDPNVRSVMGASGYMQVMPATFSMMKKRYGTDISNYSANQQNIIIGAYSIDYLYDRYDDWQLTFAAYNAGTVRVDECRCVPNIPETRGYVSYITSKKD